MLAKRGRARWRPRGPLAFDICAIALKYALSFGHYGAVRGIDRLMRTLDRVKFRASVMVRGVLAERAPHVAELIGGVRNEIVAHGYA